MPIYDYECTRCAHRFETDHEGRGGRPGVPRLRGEGDETAPRPLPDERLVDGSSTGWKSGSARRNSNRENAKGAAIEKIHGNLTGLGPAEIKRIGQLYRRRVPPERIVTHDLARQLTELSRETQPPDRPPDHPPG